MKKSKVIIPAMALLLFSTAASITGTVAWFSSTRVFSATASSFKVAQIEGGLTATMAAGVATTRGGEADPDGNYHSVSLSTGCELTHGSFDHRTAKVGEEVYPQTAWILNKNATSDNDYRAKVGDGNLSDAIATPSKWAVGTKETTTYYVAVSWKITFTFNFVDATRDVGIYLNPGASTMTVAPRDGETSKAAKTGEGFRIAFIATNDVASAKVWGKHTPSDGSDSTHYDLCYANGADKNTNRVEYLKTDYFTSVAANAYTAVEDLATDGDSTTDAQNKARPERIGTLYAKNADGTTKLRSIDIICVAWFEGEDLANVISAAEMDQVDVSMSFYARYDRTKAS